MFAQTLQCLLDLFYPLTHYILELNVPKGISQLRNHVIVAGLNISNNPLQQAAGRIELGLNTDNVLNHFLKIIGGCLHYRCIFFNCHKFFCHSIGKIIYFACNFLCSFSSVNGKGKPLSKKDASSVLTVFFEEPSMEHPMAYVWNTFQPQFDILTPAQQVLWPDLNEASRMGFVLYGGVAIALRLAHRQSVDFDFFCERAFDHQKLIKGLSFLNQGVVLQEDYSTLIISLDSVGPDQSRVKLSFCTVGMGRIGNPEWTADGVALVASMQDLMAHKLNLLLQRLEKKDYLDVYALVTHGYRLEDGIAGARAMYGRAFQPAESLKALAYFKGGDLHELSLEVQKDLITAVASAENLPPSPKVLQDLGGGRRMAQDAYHELLQDATRYIWWEKPNEAIRCPVRVIAQVMNIGDFDDVSRMASIIGLDQLREAVLHAEPGWFNERSWNYWCYRLGITAPGDPLPQCPNEGF